MITILVIGADPFGVLVFEILLNSGSLFNHANLNIKGKKGDFSFRKCSNCKISND